MFCVLHSLHLNIDTMSNVITYAKLAWRFAKGILSPRKSVYDLDFVFVPDDRIWYIDMPWPGDRYNLAMVGGSDKLLDFLCVEDDFNRVFVKVKVNSHHKELEGYFECERITSSLLAGADYRVHGLDGFSRTIWICPVTLTVLGHYPRFIYIRKLSRHERLMEFEVKELMLSSETLSWCRWNNYHTLGDLTHLTKRDCFMNAPIVVSTELSDLLEGLGLDWADMDGR